MTDAASDAIWERIMAVQEDYNRLEREFAEIPPGRIGWWLRWRFKRSLDAIVNVRGAHSHGGLISESQRRLPALEQASKAFSIKLARLQKVSAENV